MKFSYREYISKYPGSDDFRLILRPVITLQIAGSLAHAQWDALVDTGADETLLPFSLAEVLGVELDRELTSIAAGISGDALTIHYGEVQFQISQESETISWSALVGFVEFGSSDDELIVLGHGGFLDYFTATFNGELAELDLVANELLPVGT
jgi:predicted aspartyl protease